MSFTSDESPKREKLGTPDGRYDTSLDTNNDVQEEIERVNTKDSEINSHDLHSKSDDYIVKE